MALLTRTTSRSIDNAFALAQSSGLAYADDEASIRSGLEQAIGSPIRDYASFSIPSHATCVIMAAFDESIVVSFRGTRVVANWLSNVDIQLVPFRGGGMVHLGFKTALDSVYADIDRTLQSWSGQGRTLWITGHSLGGALALLLGAYLRFPVDRARVLPRPIAGIYTFGQPRVGTHEFCNACSINFGAYYYRYVNKNDIVTRVPPRSLFYWHIDNVEYITRSGAIQSDPAWWQVFLDSVTAGIEALTQLRVVEPITSLVVDHSMQLYIDAISRVSGLRSTDFVPIDI